MPYKSNYRKRRVRKGGMRKRHRRFKKRFQRLNTRSSLSYVGPGRAPLPDKYFTKLHYQDWLNVASGGITGVVDTVLSGNGAFDPVTGLGGRGCAGFTELSAIYGYYRVYASKIVVQIKSVTDVTATGDGIVLISADRNGTAYTMSGMIARQSIPYTKTGMINRYANGSQPLTLKNFRKTKHIFGETDIDDDGYAAAVTTLPTNEWYWHLVVGRGDQSSISAAPGFQALIKITYYIRFERRQNLAAP